MHLPPPIVDRARRYRARLDSADTELTIEAFDQSGKSRRFVDINSAGSVVLAVGVLAGGQRQAVRWLTDIREALPIGAELWLIDRANPIRSESGTARLVGRLRNGRSAEPAIPRDVVKALNDSGWTICAIERFTVRDADGTPSHWIDAIGRDLAAEDSDE